MCSGCRQQDDELDQLGQHVERLGGLGREIHGELESQSRMLDELDEEVETTHHRQEASFVSRGVWGLWAVEDRGVTFIRGE